MCSLPVDSYGWSLVCFYLYLYTHLHTHLLPLVSPAHTLHSWTMQHMPCLYPLPTSSTIPRVPATIRSILLVCSPITTYLQIAGLNTCSRSLFLLLRFVLHLRMPVIPAVHTFSLCITLYRHTLFAVPPPTTTYSSFMPSYTLYIWTLIR